MKSMHNAARRRGPTLSRPLSSLPSARAPRRLDGAALHRLYADNTPIAVITAYDHPTAQVSGWSGERACDARARAAQSWPSPLLRACCFPALS